MTDRVHGTVGASLMNVRVQAQGGINGGRGGWLASVRRGYLDIALKLAGAADSLNPRYDDVFAKAHYDVPETWLFGGRVAAHVLHAGDNLDYAQNSGSIGSRQTSDYAWLTWSGRVGHAEAPDGGNDRLQQSTVLSITRATNHRAGELRDERTIGSSVYDDRTFNALSGRQDWTLAVSPRFMMRWGADVARERAL